MFCLRNLRRRRDDDVFFYRCRSVMIEWRITRNVMYFCFHFFSIVFLCVFVSFLSFPFHFVSFHFTFFPFSFFLFSPAAAKLKTNFYRIINKTTVPQVQALHTRYTTWKTCPRLLHDHCHRRRHHHHCRHYCLYHAFRDRRQTLGVLHP